MLRTALITPKCRKVRRAVRAGNRAIGEGEVSISPAPLKRSQWLAKRGPGIYDPFAGLTLTSLRETRIVRKRVFEANS